jgi:RNA polymerase sigma-70 factor (ECF subfamily)
MSRAVSSEPQGLGAGVTYPPFVELWFVQLYQAEHGRVFRATWAFCGDRAIAEDATQEAFMRALERWPQLREQPWVTGWVTSTALNAARRLQRRRRWLRWAETAPGEAAAGADESGSVELWQVVRALPRRQREAVALHYLADLPVARVARLMGCREGTVKAHLAHAREALRGQLEEVRND